MAVTRFVSAAEAARLVDDADTVAVSGNGAGMISAEAILAALEEQYVVVGLLKDVLDRGLSVAIGTEHGLVPLAECSVVVAPYEVEGERAGTIGVLGPTRMNYARVIPLVDLTARELSRALDRRTEG